MFFLDGWRVSAGGCSEVPDGKTDCNFVYTYVGTENTVHTYDPSDSAPNVVFYLVMVSSEGQQRHSSHFLMIRFLSAT